MWWYFSIIGTCQWKIRTSAHTKISVVIFIIICERIYFKVNNIGNINNAAK